MARYGARVEGALVRDAVRAFSTRVLPRDREPLSTPVALPPDALQAAAFAARALERE